MRFRNDASRQHGFYYEQCSVVAGSLDLETYDLFTTKRQSQIVPTDADLADHSWVTSQGGGAITASNVLHHGDCDGPACILCSFETELIRIGYHDRQAARRHNYQRAGIVHREPHTEEENAQIRNICDKYHAATVSLTAWQNKTSEGTSSTLARADSFACGGTGPSNPRRMRIVSTMSENRICFHAPVPNGFEHVTGIDHVRSEEVATDCEASQNHAKRRPTPKQFLLHSVSLSEMTLNSPIFIGQTEKVQQPSSESSGNPAVDVSSNCKALWMIDTHGTKLQQFDISSSRAEQSQSQPPSSKSNYSDTMHEYFQAKLDGAGFKDLSMEDDDDPNATFYLSDDSTPKVLSPEEFQFSPDGPTPKGSLCNIPDDMPLCDSQKSGYYFDPNLDDWLDDELCSSGMSAARERSPEYASNGKDELHCWQEYGDDEPIPQYANSRARQRAASQSTTFLKSRNSYSASQRSMPSLEDLSLNRRKASTEINQCTSSDIRSATSYRINSAPSKLPSVQQLHRSGRSHQAITRHGTNEISHMECPHTVPALSSLLREGSSRNTKTTQLKTTTSRRATTSEDDFDMQHNADSYQQCSVPASPQNTPPRYGATTAATATTTAAAHPPIRSVRSTPGMRFKALEPVKSRLTPQSPKCKKRLQFTTNGFSPYAVLPCLDVGQPRDKASTATTGDGTDPDKCLRDSKL